MDLLDKEGVQEAIEYDLITHGLRLRNLGTDEFSWRDLWVIVQQAPRSSATIRAMEPDGHVWGHAEQLLASVADALQVANWQRARGKKRDRPKPIPRPGVDTGSQTYGKGPVSIEEMDAFLARRQAA